MPEKTRRSMDLAATILMAVVFLASPIIINATYSSVEKLNEDPIKCTPCQQNPPPPPPPTFPPPPPPPPKKSYCPPPPSPPPPTYIYASPPGNLYPIDHDFGAAAPGDGFAVVKLVVFGVMGFIVL